MVQKRKIQRKCVDFPGSIFKPQALPLLQLENVHLTKEEVTALYYSDYLGLRQLDSAEKMDISQATFSRELSSAHRKIAEALFDIKALFFIKDSEEETAAI